MSERVPPALKPKPKVPPQVSPKKPGLATTTKSDFGIKTNGETKASEPLENKDDECAKSEVNQMKIGDIRPKLPTAVPPRKTYGSRENSPSTPIGVKLPSMDELSSKTRSIELDSSSPDEEYEKNNTVKSTGAQIRTKRQPSVPPKRHKFSSSEEEAPPILPSRPRSATTEKSSDDTMVGDSHMNEDDDHYHDRGENGGIESDEEDRPPLPQRPRPSGSTDKTTKSVDHNTSLPSKPEKLTPKMPQKPVIPTKPALPNKQAIPSKPVAPAKGDSSLGSAYKPIPKIPAKPVQREISEKNGSPSNKVASLPPPPPKPRARAMSPPSAPPSRGTKQEQKDKALKEYDLELESEWFTKKDFAINPPNFLMNKNYSCSYGMMNGKNFCSVVFREDDLSTTKFKLVWADGGSPLDSLDIKQDVIPPPVATREQLAEGSSRFGEHVASWCEAKIGKKVGNGECWTLARDALKLSCGNHAFVSSGYWHGALLETFTGIGSGNPPKIIKSTPTDEIKRGDIIQFTSASFRYPNMALFFGDPHHTSIISKVSMSELTVLHQNVNNQKVVTQTTIDLSKLVDGEVKIFRPVSANWIKDLESI